MLLLVLIPVWHTCVFFIILSCLVFLYLMSQYWHDQKQNITFFLLCLMCDSHSLCSMYRQEFRNASLIDVDVLQQVHSIQYCLVPVGNSVSISRRPRCFIQNSVKFNWHIIHYLQTGFNENAPASVLMIMHLQM